MGDIHPGSSGCDCGTVRPDDDRVRGLRGEPDATLAGEKTVHVYWLSGDRFAARFNPFWYGAATIGGSYVALNDTYAEHITGKTVAHEYGHCLGIHHHDGGLMDSRMRGNRDGRGGADLSTITKEVFTSLDGAAVLTWGRRGIRDLGTVSNAYARGHTDIDRLGYAADQYARGRGADVFYTSNLGLTGERVPDANLLAGHFYGHDSH